MRVTEIIIDGFKSYAVRTVISGWDESFNSITGLNGSGKSNILDAICFVLGITNMQTVRAQNLQDLIYKRGQAGVTKASVTIVFDNSDEKTSPYGYNEYPQISVTRQIVLGGTSKYLINGVRAQQQAVHNLFQSVQLNINNPNFLIMQGRITKVLNMKATEILSMIEEAAGTRMFEDRKDKALKTMAKKNKKIDEINELLRDEIDPKLDKLRGEKRAWLDFQQTQSDLERLQKLVVSYDYVKGMERLTRGGEELEEKKQRVLDLDANAQRLKAEIANLEEDVKRVTAQREKELRKGGKFQALENDVKAKSHEIVRLQTVLDLKAGGYKEELEKKKEVEANVWELEKMLKEKTKVYEKFKKGHDEAKTAYDASYEEAQKKEELLQTLLTGVGSREGQENGYQGQLQDTKNRLSAALTEQEQAKLKVAHLEKRIKEEEPWAKKAKEQNSTLMKDLDGLRAQAKKVETELAKLGLGEGSEEDLQKEEAVLQQQIRDLNQQADNLRRTLPQIDFDYSDPYPGFERNKVKGVVAQLFHLEPEKMIAGTALEICAGGRLYNVVVDTEVTGSQLLDKGRLKKRVTIIPLNKIVAQKAADKKVHTAQRLCPEKVDLALTLIDYEPAVGKAMEYVFGGTLICRDADAAKQVTFDPNVRLKSVTFEGDVYDPSGTLSGGSAPSTSGVLVTLGKLNDITRQLEEAKASLAELQAIMARDRKKLDYARKLRQELNLKAHEIQLTEAQISSNSASEIIRGIEEMRVEIGKLKETIAEAKARQDAAAKEVKQVEKDISEFKNNKGGKLAELQKGVEALKKELGKKSAAMKTVQKEFQTAQLEVEQLGGDLAAAREQLEEVGEGIKSVEEEVAGLREQQEAEKQAHKALSEKLAGEHKKLDSFDGELNELQKAISSKTAQISEEALEKQTLGHEVSKFQTNQQALLQIVKTLETKHEWILEEKDHFGQPGTPYDFSSIPNMGQSKAQLKNLEERFLGMKKKINPKVMNMIDSVEKKEVSLKNMLRTVNRDKRKIEETIGELDKYKREALEKTWKKVTVDFGNIFAELLPGSFAKLEPPEGKDVSEGLEVKVCLGKVWKQSLTELSGGQRSLIALSLILALLQFKPAPMYILDEVDAALDLSHTQNIGRLIKTRFKGSQFIVVSLKDGMFQNANRVFRTRFQDGTSVVMVEKGSRG
ncbi:putative nuclear condensin complex subunit Smc2 [Terfezia claveryi]|nr:putative nuclear condensin complex subunit Smc2 [Terfezia claveryi]